MWYYLKDLEHVLWMHPGLIEFLPKPKNVDPKTEKKDVPSTSVADPPKNDEIKAKINATTDTGLNWKKLVQLKAYTELNGSFDRRLGYIVEVLKVGLDTISPGKILPQNGFIEHSVRYNAIVQFPLIGEVIDAVVFKVLPTKIIFCFMDCVFGKVSYENFYPGDDFESKSTVEIGENDVAEIVRVFTSSGDCDPPKTIKKGSIVRLKIIERRFGKNGFWLGGSMNNKYYGLRPESSAANGVPSLPTASSIKKEESGDAVAHSSKIVKS